jgi:hypothetical protein
MSILLMKVRSGQDGMNEPQVPGTPSAYADSLNRERSVNADAAR